MEYEVEINLPKGCPLNLEGMGLSNKFIVQSIDHDNTVAHKVMRWFIERRIQLPLASVVTVRPLAEIGTAVKSEFAPKKHFWSKPQPVKVKYTIWCKTTYRMVLDATDGKMFLLMTEYDEWYQLNGRWYGQTTNSTRLDVDQADPDWDEGGFTDGDEAI